MPGKTYIAFLQRAQDQFGFITTDDARSLGLDPIQLRIMASRGQLDHRTRGIYRMPTVPSGELDQYMEAVLWTGRKGVISHDSALLLYDLSDVNPAKVHLTVPADYRTRKQLPATMELHRAGFTLDEVTVHRGIPVVTAELAVHQCIARGVGWGIVRQAIDEGRAKGLLDTSTARELKRLALVGVPV